MHILMKAARCCCLMPVGVLTLKPFTNFGMGAGRVPDCSIHQTKKSRWVNLVDFFNMSGAIGRLHFYLKICAIKL
jgi:hypothetical protein